MIIQGKSAAEMAIKEGTLSLRKHGILKLKEGVTTIEEVLRETLN